MICHAVRAALFGTLAISQYGYSGSERISSALSSLVFFMHGWGGWAFKFFSELIVAIIVRRQ